ncbi:hypothetical protein K525DRAFT_207515 [Schizophyllum commune Loenen D]|nr:hypothetical protein K525DRAFT_207515 [Schizophyllum commune Loenen D]
MCSYAGLYSGELYCCFSECDSGVSCLLGTNPRTSATEGYKCPSTAFICRRGWRSQSARGAEHSRRWDEDILRADTER